MFSIKIFTNSNLVHDIIDLDKNYRRLKFILKIKIIKNINLNIRFFIILELIRNKNK